MKKQGYEDVIRCGGGIGLPDSVDSIWITAGDPDHYFNVMEEWLSERQSGHEAHETTGGGLS